MFSNKDRSVITNGHFLGGFHVDRSFHTFSRWKPRRRETEGKTKAEAQTRGIVTIYLLQFCAEAYSARKIIAACLPENQRNLFPSVRCYFVSRLLGFRLSGRCPRFNPRMPFSPREEVFRSRRTNRDKKIFYQSILHAPAISF